MRLRPLVPVAAAAAAASLLIASAGPAAAATGPAAGDVSSFVNLLDLDVAGQQVSVGGVDLVSTTLQEVLAKVTVTPLRVNGTAYGQQVITDQSSKPVAGAGLSDLAETADLGPLETVTGTLSGLIDVTGPDVVVSATETADSALTSVGAADLGALSVLGMDLTLDGTAQAATGASGKQASGSKTLALEDLALPTLGDLLDKLGLDLGLLSELAPGTLNELFGALGLANAAVAAAQGGIDAAQANVDSASAAVGAADPTQANADLVAATGALTAAETALNAQLALVTAPLLLLYPGSNTIAGYSSATDAAKTAIDVVVPGLDTAFAAYEQASTAADIAQAAANVANAAAGAVAEAQALLQTLRDVLDGLLQQVDALIAPLLDGVPLLSLDRFAVQTSALVTSATTGGQTAKVTGGEISGLKVLGTDILASVLGSSTVDVVDLTSGALAQVDGAIAELTGALSDVLTGAVPGLELTAPEITVLDKVATTSITDGFGVAQAGLAGLSITLPQITLPEVLQVPAQGDGPVLAALPPAQLPAFLGVGADEAGALTSNPASLTLLTVGEQSRFRPSVTTVANPPVVAPTGPTPTAGPVLATTGSAASIAGLAALLMVAAAAVRRRRVDEV